MISIFYLSFYSRECLLEFDLLHINLYLDGTLYNAVSGLKSYCVGIMTDCFFLVPKSFYSRTLRIFRRIEGK